MLQTTFGMCLRIPTSCHSTRTPSILQQTTPTMPLGMT